MVKKLEFWGILGTVGYLIIIISTVAFKFESFLSLGLNELGDFLAGVFGPIAFLWLVLGYLQQGRELKLSSDALHLQAQELKNSVDQQKELVAASKGQQIALENNTRLENERIASSIEPKYVLVGGYMPERKDGAVFKFILYNGGFLVTDLVVRHNDIVVHHKPILSSGASTDFCVVFEGSESVAGGELRVTYLNGVEYLREKVFGIGFVKFGGETGFEVLIDRRQGEFVRS